MDHNEKCQCHEYRKEMDLLKLTLITIMADSSKEGNREDRKKYTESQMNSGLKGQGNAGMLFNPDQKHIISEVFEILVSNPPFFKGYLSGQCSELAHEDYNRAIEYEGESIELDIIKSF